MDILDEMTKEELVLWIRGKAAYFLRPAPKKSSILWLRYESAAKIAANNRTEHLEKNKLLDFSKRDEYARRFNETQDNTERLELIKKMEPYERKLKKYLDEGKALRAEDDKVDRMYKKMEAEREKEAKQCQV